MQFVDALLYKPEGRGFDSRWCHWNFSLTWPLTEMSTRNISWGLKVRRADNLTTFTCQLSWNLGASTSWNPLGLSRPDQGLLYLLHYIQSVPFREHTVLPSERPIGFCCTENKKVVYIRTNMREFCGLHSHEPGWAWLVDCCSCVNEPSGSIKYYRISWLPEKPLPPQDGPRSLESVYLRISYNPPNKQQICFPIRK